MTENHPITPSPELLKQWVHEFYGGVPISPGEASVYIATQDARWGADQELEACISLMLEKGWMNQSFADNLRAARRPKPPSLKEQALAELDSLENMGACNADTIRRALEALPE
jgi:hypothetical protein